MPYLAEGVDELYNSTTEPPQTSLREGELNMVSPDAAKVVSYRNRTAGQGTRNNFTNL